MAKYTINSFVVTNCKNEIVAMDSYFNVQGIVNKCNRGDYLYKPYKYMRLQTTIEL